MRGDDEIAVRNMRWTALWTTIVTFLLALILWARFRPGEPGFQFVEHHEWLGGVASYHMGVDGISMLFVILTDLPDADLHSGELAVSSGACANT